ncbi:DNA polymerase Y family protein [Burkholderia stagnalis]|uniref:DNA polymerase Y family protein n=1 Tax=Burkholderia stagnalis TaxID=1503054 RepID=A0ABX9YQL4_9BURK|nr:MULTISPECIES: DNA polymerase Y family protein [Burkholderia]MDD1493932.1 DNA polymerase Y family protein [Burkholderia thailandensis]RQY93862.1 DNA polymerase Y family protein [Burkholderia stagnalis]RQZ19583.1 DNA polymerase Y family protein [Burkholderia stagnalis]
MPVWIGVCLPSLTLESFRPRSPVPSPDDARGLVVLEHGRVMALDGAARALGVVAGMRRGGVLSLAPDAQICERDVAGERELALAVAYALLQFTPSVVDADEAVVLLDVTASLRLFRGIRALRARVRDLAASFGVSAAVSVASTGSAAWVLARGLRGGLALSARSLHRALARVSLIVAPPARAYAEWFDELGCSTLADLQRLPRAGLKKRCGTQLLDWLDQVAGIAPAAYEWLEMPPSFDARVELMDRVDHAEALLFVTRRLILQLTGWLTAKQLDVAEFALRLEHERGRDAIAPTEIEIALGAPTRFEEHLTRLVKERLAHVELAAPVIAVRLIALRVQEAAAPSDSLFPEPGGTPQDHARLLELLTARLGAENVRVPAPIADYRPEAAARWVPLRDAPKPTPLPADLPRPAWLLDKPVALLTRQHRPFYGSPLRMVSPGERIEGGWQDGRIVTRDYFVAEDEAGVCYWIFKERPSASDDRESRYYLHGLFG